MTVRMSIVILNFNKLAELQRSIVQLRGLLADRDDCEVIAVDNGSSDGSATWLGSQSDFLVPLLRPENSGIAGYNTGFERARGDYILVLDDDSTPTEGTTLDRLISQLDADPSVGVVACRIEDGNGRRVWSWHLPRADQSGPSMAFVGCGFAIRRDLFKRIGWYPEEYFLYQNELEVAIRVRLAGYQIHYEPTCRITHRTAGQARAGWRRVYFPTRNTLWLLRRYARYPQAPYLIVSRTLIGLLQAARLGQWKAWLSGLSEGLRHPVPHQPLPADLWREFMPLWRQNSLWHQLIRRA